MPYLLKNVNNRLTINGGSAGWRAVLPNEKHEFSAGWRAAEVITTRVCLLDIRKHIEFATGVKRNF